MGFPSKRDFQLSATQRFFSSSAAAGCSLPSCRRCTAHAAGMEQPDAARLLWSPSQFTDAAPKLPREVARDAGQAVTESSRTGSGAKVDGGIVPASTAACPWAITSLR